jgi:hypothetical protein
MTPRAPDTLGFTDRALQVLTGLNVVYAVGLVVLLGASILVPGPLLTALSGAGGAVAPGVITGMRLMMVVGMAAVPLAHIILTRLRSMIGTVRDGDPFVLENARRLNIIGSALLGIELLHLVIGVIAKSDAFTTSGIHVDWSFSFTPWIAVLLLFVLARVFQQGAHMRADLEGTV